MAGHDGFPQGISRHLPMLNGGAYGNNTFNVEANTGPLILNGGADGTNTFNFGSLAPLAGGVLSGWSTDHPIGGANMGLFIPTKSPGTNIVNVDDTGDPISRSGTLTATKLTGFGMGAGITYCRCGYAEYPARVRQ